jgi:hypothetical protein
MDITDSSNQPVLNSHIAGDRFRTSAVNDGSVANHQVMFRRHAPLPEKRQLSRCISAY